MKFLARLNLVFLVICSPAFLNAQNETSKWYFGNQAGLDFMTSPPTVLSGSMMAVEGSASIASSSGSLLFYTEGQSVWNLSHAVMANGTGLLGNASSTQSSLIIKQPGSANLYYVFTQQGQNFNNGWGVHGLRYSIVDMSLAAGMGSVTVKNMPLHAPCTEKVIGTKHCNGVDYWVMTHDWESNTFRAYLLTAAGVNTTAVLSQIGPMHSNTTPANIAGSYGCLKISPNGKKLAVAVGGTASTSGFELYDFDNSTGIVTNSLVLLNTKWPYGVEFSPNSTRLYGTEYEGTKSVYQWDLCAGSPQAILASKYTVFSMGTAKGTLQLSLEGKIYVACFAVDSLAIIHNPDIAGPGCNYADHGISIGPNVSGYGLPNFIPDLFRALPPPFTTTLNCQQVSFTGLPGTGTFITNCAASGNSLTGFSWNFGDGSPANTTVQDPIHFYSSPGNYTVHLVLNHNCSSDTIKKVITITALSPTFSVSQPSAMCKGETATLTASGSDNYTWSNGASGSSIVVTPSVSTPYTVVATNSITGCTYSMVSTLSVNKCLSLNEPESLESISIYPNPTSGQLIIQTDQAFELIISDQMGKILLFKKITASSDQVDISMFTKGFYFIKVISRSGTKVKRIIVH